MFRKLTRAFNEGWKNTPESVRRFFLSPITRLILVAVIAGIIGNQSDKIFSSQLVPWAFSQTSIYNSILVLLCLAVLLVVILLWMLVSVHESFRVKLETAKNELLKPSKTNVAGFPMAPISTDTALLLHDSGAIYDKMTSLLTESSVKYDLRVSVGEADFARAWLARLYEDSAAGRGSLPKINRVIVRQLSPSTCKLLEESGCLALGFETRLKGNIRFLRKVLSEHGIKVEVRSWNKLPPFHGFAYGDNFLLNSWDVNREGHLHVRTPLFSCSANEQPELYDFISQTFTDFY